MPSIFGSAESAIQNLLNPDFNVGNNRFANESPTNEYIQSAFDRAANLSQGRLASEFSRAGRFGSQAQQTLRADELGAISSNLLLPLMENERNRQFSATESNLGRALQSRQLASQSQLGGINPALNLGQLMQSNQQQRLDAPETALNRQIARQQAMFPFFPGTQNQQTNQQGQVTQPLFNNPLSSFFGGALAGQSLFGR
jgi:hypothetical protein